MPPYRTIPSNEEPNIFIHRWKIHGMFLDILFYGVNIRKLSAFCPLGVDYYGNFLYSSLLDLSNNYFGISRKS